MTILWNAITAFCRLSAFGFVIWPCGYVCSSFRYVVLSFNYVCLTFRYVVSSCHYVCSPFHYVILSCHYVCSSFRSVVSSCHYVVPSFHYPIPPSSFVKSPFGYAMHSAILRIRPSIPRFYSVMCGIVSFGGFIMPLCGFVVQSFGPQPRSCGLVVNSG